MSPTARPTRPSRSETDPATRDARPGRRRCWRNARPRAAARNRKGPQKRRPTRRRAKRRRQRPPRRRKRPKIAAKKRPKKPAQSRQARARGRRLALPRKRPDDAAKPLDQRARAGSAGEEPAGTKRDIARKLGVKGNRPHRAQAHPEGARERRHHRAHRQARLHQARQLPEVCVLEVIGQDTDGELLARPLRWEHETRRPPSMSCSDATPKPAGRSGLGERILARLSESRDGYEARIIKKLGASVHRVLGVYRDRRRATAASRRSTARSRTNSSSMPADRGGAEQRTRAGRAACRDAPRACRARASSSGWAA